MSVYNVPGQDDLSLAIGAGGDKTVTVDVTGATHVRIWNEDPQQHVLYTFDGTPTFPDDWSRLDPRENVVVPTGGSTALYLRKKTFIRGEFATNDVPISVQVGESTET
jgi:hypothetical protein